MNPKLPLVSLLLAGFLLGGCTVELQHEPAPPSGSAGPPPSFQRSDPDDRRYRSRIDLVAFDEPMDVELLLALRRDGRFRLDASIVTEDEIERGAVTGTWERRGDTIILTGADGGDAQAFRLRGENLEMETGWGGDVILGVLGLPRLTFRPMS